MKKAIKTFGTLLFTVTLDCNAKDLYTEEIYTIINQVAFNTDLTGFQTYSVERCDFLSRAKRFQVARNDANTIKFNFNIAVNGVADTSKTLELADCVTNVPMVSKVQIKYAVSETSDFFQVQTKSTIEAKSDSPIDLAIAEAVELVENQRGKKGFYRKLQKALKKVKNYDSNIVKVRLNGKSDDLAQAALALKSYTTVTKEKVNKAVVLNFKPKQQEENEDLTNYLKGAA